VVAEEVERVGVPVRDKLTVGVGDRVAVEVCVDVFVDVGVIAGVFNAVNVESGVSVALVEIVEVTESEVLNEAV